jgi:hypothetical protein
MLISGYYLGDFKGTKVLLNNDYLLLGIIIQISSYFILFLLYNKLKIKNKENFGLINQLKYLDYFILLYLILNIYLAYNYNFGRLVIEADTNFKFSTFFNILNIDIIFYIYFISYKKNIHFKILNSILFSFLKLYQGSIGFFWDFFIIIIMKYSNKKIDIKKIFLFNFAILTGAYIYKLVYPIRTFIRFGYTIEINYIEALGNLVSRISPINNLYNIFELGDNLFNKVNYLTINFSEIMGFFRRIVPSGFMKKDFYVINQVFMFTKNKNYNLSGSYDTTLIGKLVILFNKSFIEFIFYIIFIIFILFIFRLLLKKIGNRYLNIYFFITLIGLFNSGSIEVSISLKLIVIFSFFIAIKSILFFNKCFLKNFHNKELTDK